MNRPSSAFVALGLALVLLAPSFAVLAQAPAPSQPLAAAPGVMLVGLRPGVSLANAGALGAQSSDPALAAAFARLGVTAAEPLLPIGKGGLSARAAQDSPLGHIYRLRLPADANVLAAARELEAAGTRPNFLYREQMVAIYVDGPIHDQPDIVAEDRAVEEHLMDAGYTPLRFRYADGWEALAHKWRGLFGMGA